MDRIDANTRITTAIVAIKGNEAAPVVNLKDKIYVLDLRDIDMGVLVYTSFSPDTLTPIETHYAKYGSHHTIKQIILNPVPKSVHPPEHTEIPTYIHSTPMVDPTIILGKY